MLGGRKIVLTFCSNVYCMSALCTQSVLFAYFMWLLQNILWICGNMCIVCRNYSRFSCCSGKVSQQNEEKIDKSQGEVLMSLTVDQLLA